MAKAISLKIKEQTLTKNILTEEKYLEAKKSILAMLAEQSAEIKAVKKADPQKSASYQKALEELSENRGGALWYPYIGTGRGNGTLVELADGSVKYDMICGIGVHFFGHNHLKLASASIDAAMQDTIMQGHLQQNEDQARLIKRLCELSGMQHCMLTSSGVMACENALKILFQKHAPANRLLAFEHCFMGRTLACAQITDKAAFRDGLPDTLKVDYVPFYDEKDPAGSTQRSLSVIKEHIARNPGKIAGMSLELVQGEGGFKIGSRDYFLAIMSLLKENKIAVLADEVQSFGRTEELFAFQHLGLEDYVDLVTIGKLSQVCATLYKADYKPRAGLLSQTFTSSASAIHSALYILDELTEGKYYGKNGKNAEANRKFAEGFEAIAKRKSGLISGPYGIGAMLSFVVYGGEQEKTVDFVKRLYEAGVISFTCGRNPLKVRFLLPTAILKDEDIQNVLAIVETCLE